MLYSKISGVFDCVVEVLGRTNMNTCVFTTHSTPMRDHQFGKPMNYLEIMVFSGHRFKHVDMLARHCG